MLRRPAVVTALIFGAVFFLGVSVFLARGLSATGSERSQVLEVVEAQARGDSAAVLARLSDCRRVPACTTALRARAPRLRTPGEVEILAYEPSLQLAITRQVGTGRVAWRAGDSLPVVQCVKVRRFGAMEGAKVELVSISGPLPREAPCR